MPVGRNGLTGAARVKGLRRAQARRLRFAEKRYEFTRRNVSVVVRTVKGISPAGAHPATGGRRPDPGPATPS